MGHKHFLEEGVVVTSNETAFGGGSSRGGGAGRRNDSGGSNHNSGDVQNYETNVDLNNFGNPVEVAGRGHTGRTTPINLKEQMAMYQVQSNPLDGAINLSTVKKKLK